ncbi:hypothetical protein [Burkholderia sp. BCC1993]|uniref:hypothetical protein n=1 Tax=Burkholderia sp. BCC1993 TaxID=2817444 RepID=UPI002AB0281C|nr:hypothetical protein [Burkholderia sp. BCC1993]
MELNQLVLCKQLYSEAESFMSRNEAVASGLAVSIAQDAVELFLRAVIKQLPSTGQKPPEEFIKCMDYIDASAGGHAKTPFRARMTDLNKARVNFKHYGLVPSAADAVRLLGYVDQFFEVATPQFFSCEFSSVSLSDLITSPEVRAKIKSAELAEKEGDIAEALATSAEAVELAASALIKRLQPGGPDVIPSQLVGALGQHGAGELARYMHYHLEGANRSALTLALPLNLNDVLRFKATVPSLIRLGDGAFARNQRVGTETLSIADATFAVSFATRYALAIDSRMPTRPLSSIEQAAATAPLGGYLLVSPST